MRHVAANALTILIVLGLALSAVIAWGVQRYRAPGPHADARLVVIEKGSGLATITKALDEAGVLGDPSLFRIGAKYEGRAKAMKFGEYEIPARASMQEIAALLVQGKSVEHPITVVEGWTVWQVAQAVKASSVLV